MVENGRQLRGSFGLARYIALPDNQTVGSGNMPSALGSQPREGIIETLVG